MSARRVLVLGGGMAGMAAADALAEAGGSEVTLIEAAPELGGLAGSFVREGRSFPLGYHHILHRDRTLLFYFHLLGLSNQIRWRRIRMFFRVGGRNYNLASPGDFSRFPMATADKFRFARMMLRAFARREWSSWVDRSAAQLIDRWAGPGVRTTLFEPLTEIKFGLPCEEVSGAWLGARLYHREGSAALGYIPNGNWTDVLCRALGDRLAGAGVRIRIGTPVERIETRDGRLSGVELKGGERLEADLVVSTLPTGLLSRLLPEDDTPALREIEYTALDSVICATRQPLGPEFYWMNLHPREHGNSGIFVLDALNPTLGQSGEHYVNFVTHYHDRTVPRFADASEEQLVERCREDFRRVFGMELEARWIVANRLARYSPILHRGYRNPPVRSTRYENLFFAGNFRTFPSVVTTGTALGSGLEAAAAVLAAESRSSDLVRRSLRHRKASMLWRWRARG